MSKKLSIKAFARTQNTVFTTKSGEDEPVDLKLVEVTDKTPEGFPGEQFSIVFEGPADAPLGQQTYQLEHGDMGSLELFLVPVGEQDDKRFYEAFFNRLKKGSG